MANVPPSFSPVAVVLLPLATSSKAQSQSGGGRPNKEVFMQFHFYSYDDQIHCSLFCFFKVIHPKMGKNAKLCAERHLSECQEHKKASTHTHRQKTSQRKEQ